MVRIIKQRGLLKHLGEDVVVESRGTKFVGLLYAEEDNTMIICTSSKKFEGEIHYYLRKRDKIQIENRTYEFAA